MNTADLPRPSTGIELRPFARPADAAKRSGVRRLVAALAPATTERPATDAAPPLTRRSFIGRLTLAAAAPALVRAATPSPWQIGCYTRPWAADTDYRVALDGIAAAGYAFAGLMTMKGGVLVSPETAPEKVATMAADAKARGLQIASIYGGNFIAKTIADGVANLQRLIDHVARCGCPSLLLGGTSRPEQVDGYYQVVAECCAYAASRGVGLTIKPHGGSNSTGPQCRELIARVGHPNFRLWYDAGNIFYYSDGKLDPVDDAATVDGLVVGMSVKDFLPPKEVNLTPGTGRVDFARVMRRLHAGGFTRGPLVVECVANADATRVTAEARRAREFVEGLVAKLPGRS